MVYSLNCQKLKVPLKFDLSLVAIGENDHITINSYFNILSSRVVTFSSEENCIAAHNTLAKKKFREQPIHARIKSETLMKSL